MTALTAPLLLVEHSRSTQLHIALDPAEHARRTGAGLGGIYSYGQLDLLLGLPVGMPVPVASLDARDRRTLKRLPAGAVTVTSGMVTRHAVRPCKVMLATVRGTVTQATMTRAGRFAPFCSRTIITPTRPRADKLFEADFYGIGVVLEHDGQQETLVEPRPWRLMRHTCSGWAFVERAYELALKEADL